MRFYLRLATTQFVAAGPGSARPFVFLRQLSSLPRAPKQSAHPSAALARTTNNT